jgi:hypothetical protein
MARLPDTEFAEFSLTAPFYAMLVRMPDAARLELEPEARDCPPRLP